MVEPYLPKLSTNLYKRNYSDFLGKEENKILGQPLPSENQPEYDFQEILDEYTFHFDLGLAPTFALKGVDDGTEYEKYAVEISDEEVVDHLEEALEQIGQLTTIEEDIEDDDIITIEGLEKGNRIGRTIPGRI